MVAAVAAEDPDDRDHRDEAAVPRLVEDPAYLLDLLAHFDRETARSLLRGEDLRALVDFEA